MPIKIKGTQKIDEEKQWVFMTIEVQGEDVEYTHVSLLELSQQELQDYVDVREDGYKLNILKDMYPESDHLRFKTEDKNELEAMEEWITKGHKNKVQTGLTAAGKPKYEDQIIEKKELEYKHPKEIGLAARIEAANLTPELKELLQEIIK